MNTSQPVVAKKLKMLIPAKYAKAETSGLLAVVNSDSDNEIDFNLVIDPAIASRGLQ